MQVLGSNFLAVPGEETGQPPVQHYRGWGTEKAGVNSPRDRIKVFRTAVYDNESKEHAVMVITDCPRYADPNSKFPPSTVSMVASGYVNNRCVGTLYYRHQRDVGIVIEKLQPHNGTVIMGQPLREKKDYKWVALRLADFVFSQNAFDGGQGNLRMKVECSGPEEASFYSKLGFSANEGGFLSQNAIQPWKTRLKNEDFLNVPPSRYDK